MGIEGIAPQATHSSRAFGNAAAAMPLQATTCPPSSCEDPFPPPQPPGGAGGFPAPARGRGWMQVSKIMLHHACLVLCSLAQRCSGWGPRGSPPAAELPRHGVAVRGCGLWAQVVAAAHARSPLQLCTHSCSEKLQRALLAALQNWGGPQQGILTTPKSHPRTPPVQSHRERGNSARRAAGTGTRTQPVFPLDLDILQPPCGFTSSPSLRTWLWPRIPPQSPAPALTCSWPGRRWRSGGSCPAAWPPGAVFWHWRPSRRCPRRPWP